MVLRAVAEQGGDPGRLLRSGRERKPSGRFNACGRGRGTAAALNGHGGWEFYADTSDGAGMRFRARRVIVKARVVKLKGVESQAIAAHLRYLQREGVTLRSASWSRPAPTWQTMMVSSAGRHDGRT